MSTGYALNLLISHASLQFAEVQNDPPYAGVVPGRPERVPRRQREKAAASQCDRQEDQKRVEAEHHFLSLAMQFSGAKELAPRAGVSSQTQMLIKYQM